MLIAPVMGGPFTSLTPPCEVCRLGHSTAAVFHSWGSFLVCSWCAQAIAAALVVRVAFAADPERLDPDLIA